LLYRINGARTREGIGASSYVQRTYEQPMVEAGLNKIWQGFDLNAIQRCYLTTLFFKIIVSKLNFSSIR